MATNHKLRILIALSSLVALLVVLAFISGLLDDAGVSSESDEITRHSNEVLRAFRLLMDNSVEERDSSTVLMAAWQGATKVATSEEPKAAAHSAPDFTGNASTDGTIFDRALREILRDLGDDAARQRVALASIDEMAQSFANAHTLFIPPASWERIQAGEGFDLGVSTVRRLEGALVWDVLPGSPAHNAGVRPGDLITGAIAQGMFPDGGPLRADPVQPITIVVRRSGSEMQLEIRPDGLTATVDWGFLANNLAYLRVYTFETYSEAEAQKASSLLETGLTVLESFRPSGWVIDLRNNPGGSAHFAAYLGGRLGATGAFLEHVSRFGVEEIDLPDVRDITGGKPVVVLVNEGTASAAEALAEVLRQQGRAMVLGNQTRGAVFAASYFEVAGGALQIATARGLVGAARRDLNGVGVTPDLAIDLDEVGLPTATYVGVLRESLVAGPDAEYDSQLQAAIDLLAER